MGSRNFSVAGHRKGAPDGVRATVKHLADRLVLRGVNIPDKTMFFNEVQPQTSVTLYLVKKEAIEGFKDVWMNQAYSRLSTTHGQITDCKLLVCM